MYVMRRIRERRNKRRVSPVHARDARVTLTQTRRDIQPLDRIIAFFEEHGVAVTKELGLLSASFDVEADEPDAAVSD